MTSKTKQDQVRAFIKKRYSGIGLLSMSNELVDFSGPLYNKSSAVYVENGLSLQDQCDAGRGSSCPLTGKPPLSTLSRRKSFKFTDAVL